MRGRAGAHIDHDGVHGRAEAAIGPQIMLEVPTDYCQNLQGQGQSPCRSTNTLVGLSSRSSGRLIS